MSRTVTLSHVAREAGVSPSTVSRILNGTAQVAVEKRERVVSAIERLGYQPNVQAQALARGRSMTIGVMTQELSSPFYGEGVVGIEQGLHGSGYHPLTVSGHWREDQEREALDVLLKRNVDALIVLGGNLDDEHFLRVARRMPVVAVGRTIRGLEERCLQIDNAAGSAEAVRHLIELGHRRIAHISGPYNQADSRERLSGYRRALSESGIPFDERLVVEGDFSEHSGLLAAEALFSRAAMFTAIASANDQMALGARLALYRRGVRVPDDVSIVGFDDLFAASYMTPPLTSVRQSMTEMGRCAAEGILALLEGRGVTFKTYSLTLIRRESTAMLRRAPGSVVPGRGGR